MAVRRILIDNVAEVNVTERRSGSEETKRE
jgi:hypothetical protein